MFCYCRSQDVGLGTGFNIASSSLLLMLISKLTNLTSRYMNISMGDTHIYAEHIQPIKSQLERIPYTFPKLILPEFKTIEDVEKLSFEDFKLIDYKYYPTIKMHMVA
jgi:thymidylate synthase